MLNIKEAKQKKIICGVILGIILLSAFLLRFNGLTFGLPLKIHPDEGKIVNRAIKILQNHDLNPHFFNYPSFYIYAQSVVYVLVYGFGKITGSFGDVFGAGISTLYIAGRFLTLLLSIGTLFIIYILGKLLFNRIAGLIAVLIVASSSLHVQQSIFITVDSPMTFLVSLSFLMSALIMTRGPQLKSELKYYIWGGLLAGLAIGTKYTSILIVLPLIYAHLYTRKFKIRNFFSKEIVIGLLVVVLAFIISTPYAILDFGNFAKDIRFESQHYSTGHAGNEAAGTSYLPYLSLLVDGIGVIPLMLSFAGLLILLVTDKWKGIFIAIFPLVFFLFIGRYKVYFPRNLLPLIPFLAIFAGVTVGMAYRWFHQSGHLVLPWIKNALFSAFIIVVSYGMFMQAEKSVEYIQVLTLPNTQIIAGKWIEENLPAGSKIGLDFYTPRPDRRKYNITISGVGGLGRHKKLLEQFHYVVASSGDYERFFNAPTAYKKEVTVYNYIFKRYILLKEFKPEHLRSFGPVIRIYKVVK